jgi:uncharacterized membrane protein YozB (DUF420 family)
MKHRMTRAGREVALLLWSCIALFAARVIGQFEALVAAPPWLPDMEAWYSGVLPYYLLLPVQIALLMIMAVVAWNRRVRTGRFALAHPRLARVLRSLAVLYFVVMAVRLGFAVHQNGADYWGKGAIPVAFHWVLALFMLVSARHSLEIRTFGLPSEDDQEDDEPDDVPHGDVPALAQPLAYGSAFGKEIRYRDAG